MLSVSLCRRDPNTPWLAAGRLVYREPPKAVIADAFAEVEVAFAAAADGVAAKEGDWIVVGGTFDGSILRNAVLQRSSPGVDGDGEGKQKAGSGAEGDGVVRQNDLSRGGGADGYPHSLPSPRRSADGPSDWDWFQRNGRRRSALLKLRGRLLQSIRSYFEGEQFLETETPARVRSPGIETFVDAFSVEHLAHRGAPDRYLQTSPEFHMKRLLSAGFPRIYQLCRCFRQGEVGELHQPEFMMLEWYRSFADCNAVMTDTEALTLRAQQALQDFVPANASTVDCSPPWPRVTVADAFSDHAQQDAFALAQNPERFSEVMATQVQPKLGLKKPVFLVDWPTPLASLAQRNPNNPAVAERFEAYVQGVELCNGFTELTDPVEQRTRFEQANTERVAAGKAPYPIDGAFLAALRHGLPPAGGNALGVDRLLMLLTGTANIADVVAFDESRS